MISLGNLVDCMKMRKRQKQAGGAQVSGLSNRVECGAIS